VQEQCFNHSVQNYDKNYLKREEAKAITDLQYI